MWSIETHINKVCSSEFYYLHNLRRTITIVSCMVSRSVKFQKYREYRTLLLALHLTLVNSAITPAMRQLHWLPVVKRIQFKILLLTFKTIHSLSPPYISELITVKPKSTYGLHSNNSTLVLPPTQKMLPTLGACSFALLPMHFGTNCLLILEMLLP